MELSSLGMEEFVNRKLIFVPSGHSLGVEKLNRTSSQSFRQRG
jgi:hypothetical protein